MPNWTQRRVLGEQSPSEHNRLRVRLVPYTPPRLSSASDGTCAHCQCHQGPNDYDPASNDPGDNDPGDNDPGSNDPSRFASPNVAVHASSRSWSRSWSRSRSRSHRPPSSPCSSASSQRVRQPLRRRRARLITIRASSRNFSLLTTPRPAPPEATLPAHSFSTTPHQSQTTPQDRPVSPLTPLPAQPSSNRPRSRDSHSEAAFGHGSYPLRSRRFVQGLRRVRHPRRYIRTSTAFASPALSTSTLSSSRNFTTHVHRDASPLQSPNLTPTSSNVRVLAESPCDDHNGDATLVCVHGQPPLACLRPEFSRESMVVPPLRYKSSSPPDNHASWRSRSGSLASASSVMVDEVARSLFAAVGAPRRLRPPHHASDSTASCPCQRCGHTSGLDPPPALLSRHATRQQSRGTIRAVRDHDEHGDGLADLDQIPSRPRLYSFRSSLSSDRQLPSSSGSRRSSLSRSSIPVWARLYYGSGERRFLAPKSSLDSLSSFYDRPRPSIADHRRARAGTIDSRLTEGTCIVDSRPGPLSLHNRPHDLVAPCEADDTASIPHPQTPTQNTILRHQTSSIWSPHLGPDRRAIEYSIWEPPSSLWSRSWLGACRDYQPLLFVVGFLCPIAWMVASFLSLPPRPSHNDLIQVRCNTSHFHPHIEANHLTSDDLLIARRYSRARWWRSLNRAMSVLGVFVIGAAVALIVTGVKQKRL